MSARILILVALFAASIAYAIQPDPMLNPLGLAILCLETTLLSLGLDALCRWSRWTVVIGLPLALGWIVLRLPDIAYRHDMGVEDLGRAPFIPEYIASFAPILFLLLGFCRTRPDASNHAMQRTAPRSDA
jgi:hypothetical protein